MRASETGSAVKEHSGGREESAPRLAARARARKVRCVGLAWAVLEGFWGEEQQVGTFVQTSESMRL